MNANNPKDKSLSRSSSNVPASQTDFQISTSFGHTAGALQSAFRMDIHVGVVAITTGATVKHQHTNLPGLWQDGKTVAITASTNKSATANASTDQLTVTSHGYAENQPVVIAGTAVPGGTEARKIYWVKVIDANTISLRPNFDSSGIVDLTSAGSSVTVTAVRAFSISYLPTVAGDQAHMPLRSTGRAVITTGSGDSVDVLSVIVNQED